MKLYHYVHCPFCIRVRMALGFLKMDHESVVLDYDDEITPVKLTGVKMLPILEVENKAINESLDIIEFIDQKNLFGINKLKATPIFSEVEKLLDLLGKDVHSLAMPYWIYTKEFTPKAREYFQSKKEKKRGPFNELVHNRKSFLAGLTPNLTKLENMLSQNFINGEFSILDIMIASHLWGLYVVPEFQFSVKLNNYLQKIAELTSFDYHKDLWR